jgi:hypothetical protein
MYLQQYPVKPYQKEKIRGGVGCYDAATSILLTGSGGSRDPK